MIQFTTKSSGVSFISILIGYILSLVDTHPLVLPDHSAWNTELAKYVSTQGEVNYKYWVNHQDELDSYLTQLSAAQPISNWSTNVQLAYWINAYNAFTIKLVLENYPVKSIKDIEDGKPWDHAWINLGGKNYSLNQIENEILRDRFKEPRVHFALNCAARSCPPLLNEAYDPARLGVQLNERTKYFVTENAYNQTDSSPIRISQLFNWYQTDFAPDVISFLNSYLSSPINKDVEIEYMEYDWRLNEE